MTRRGGRIKGSVDISGFGELVKQLSKMSGKDFEKTLKAEVGHVVKSTISKTPQSSIKGRKTKKGLKGGIVPRHIPQGLDHQKGDGRRLITVRDGRKYHVGKPIIQRINPDERVVLDKAYRKRMGINTNRYSSPSGKFPLRGGKVYLWPKTYWLGRNKFWGEFIPKTKQKVDRKIQNIGMAGGQFYWMAKNIGLPIPGGKVKGQRLLQKSSVRSKVSKFIKPRLRSKKHNSTITLLSSGMKVSRYVQAQNKLMAATKGRLSFFKRSVKNGFTKDLKKYMPKNYPLLFK